MAPAPPLLYSYRRCPYAMRARMALLMALMVAVVAAFLWMTVRRIRAESAGARTGNSATGSDAPS